MPTVSQIKKVTQSLRNYKRKYIIKRFSELDESATRLMINSFLTDVLDYEELVEIKTEYAIRGAYADYVIQVGNKKQIVVEVKSIQASINENHLRQALGYAANEGIDWLLLTNGKMFDLYRVIFGKPIGFQQIFSVDLSKIDQFKNAAPLIAYITKKSVEKGELNKYWKKCQALDPVNVAKYLLYPEVVRFVRRQLRKKVDIRFTEEDVFNTIYLAVANEVALPKPHFKKTI
jgi:hypothetical protein